MPSLEIETGRLRIRHLLLSDLADFYGYRSDPGISKYQGFDTLTMETAELFIRDNETRQFGQPGEWVQYGIEHRDQAKLIGDCAIKLDQQDPRMAAIGISIAAPEQQKGFAKEALNGLLGFLFDKNKIRRVLETVDAENIASIRLLESTGFRKEEQLAKKVFFKGKWGAEWQYAMRKTDWNARNK